MDISININPTFEKMTKAYAEISDDITKAMQKLITEFAFTTERYAKQVTPVDSGRLRSSIAVSQDVGDKLSARVGTWNVGYSLFVHEGTRYMRARPFMKYGLEFALKKFDDQAFSSRIDVVMRNKLSRL